MAEHRNGQVDGNATGDRIRELAERAALLSIARRMLKCPTATVQATDAPVALENALRVDLHQCRDLCDVALVVADEPGRVWSDDDARALDEIACCLAVLVEGEFAPATDGGMEPVPVQPEPGDTFNREVRTALQAIIGFTELMKREDRPEMVAAHAATIQETTEELMRSFGQHSGDVCAVQAGADDMEEAVASAESAHILLADDLDLNRKLICDMLSLDGHIVDSVADGASAVKAACERSYDLILMDMIMPGMDGVTATRAIRALPAPACEVPIVALTAHSQPEQLDSCLQAGMDATLTKPMSIDALTDAVATWTRRRRKAA